ncbi:MAG: hypothetical protein NWE90_07260 [Candidatus Bathyarchaeota archaeon]|nr:hypothetical protein [Candidatus Bathyarchaeota archaeon]
MNINPEKFQKSITEELEVVKDRVRNLIGSAHWGEEGKYKEAVLTNVMRRFSRAVRLDVRVHADFLCSENVE